MRTHRLHQTHGSMFLTAAMASGVLAILVMSLLSFLSNEFLLNLRMHLWNSTLHLAEAGTEVGFAELNYQYYQGGSGVGFLSSRGWTNTAANTYSKTVTGFTNSLSQSIGNFTVTVSGVNTMNPTIQTVATRTTVARGNSISRCIKTTLQSSSRFPSGLMAKNSIDMNGNGVYTDSFDSSDVSKSTGGLYDVAKRQSNGNIASNGSFLNSLSIGNADIYGVAYTGPGGSAYIGSQGSVGPTFVSADRATTVADGQSKGWIQSDFNMDVPDVVLPTGLSSAASLGNLNGTTSIAGGSYRASSIKLSGNSKIVTITGNVVLYVTGDVSITGNGSGIQINSGASLTIYVDGSVKVAGSGIVNSTGVANKNQWFGTTSSTSWDVAGNGQWIGTMYAPQASVSFNGGGSAGDASGAVVANNITMTGHATFHYDEQLKVSNTGAGYQFMSWIELRQVSGSWVP